MPELKEKQLKLKSFLGWTGTVFVFLIIVIFFLNNEISVQSTQIQDKKSQIIALKNREENISKFQNDYYKIEDDISTVTSVLLDEENVSSFVEYLEDLSSKYNTNLEIVFDDKANAQIEQNRYLVANLSVSGFYDGVKNMWQSLENGPYFINISSFELNTLSGLGSDTQLKLTTKIYTNEQYKISK